MKRLRNDEGSALVEFALMLPVFLLVVAAAFTFIWLLAARSAVTGAARDGARYASIQHDFLPCASYLTCDTSYPSVTEVGTYVKDRAGIFGVDSLCMVVGTESATNPCSSDPTKVPQPDRNAVITVKVTRNLPIIVGTMASLLGIHEIKYTSTAVARAE